MYSNMNCTSWGGWKMAKAGRGSSVQSEIIGRRVLMNGKWPWDRTHFFFHTREVFALLLVYFSPLRAHISEKQNPQVFSSVVLDTREKTLISLPSTSLLYWTLTWCVQCWLNENDALSMPHKELLLALANDQSVSASKRMTYYEDK